LENRHIDPQADLLQVGIVVDVEIIFFRLVKRHVIPIIFRIGGIDAVGFVVVGVKEFIDIVYPEYGVAFEVSAVGGEFLQGGALESWIARIEKIPLYYAGIRHPEHKREFSVHFRRQPQPLRLDGQGQLIFQCAVTDLAQGKEIRDGQDAQNDREYDAGKQSETALDERRLGKIHILGNIAPNILQVLSPHDRGAITGAFR
jgi:hypothetical protein